MNENIKNLCLSDVGLLIDYYEKQGKNLNQIKIERNCPNCKKSYSATLGRLKWGREVSCSKRCSYEIRGKNLERKIKLQCEVCSKTFERIPSLNTASTKLCSLDCYYEGRKKRTIKVVPGPPRKETFTFTCEVCKKTLTLPASRKGARVYRFCSLECVGKTMRGSNNYFWRGGYKVVYGNNWKVQRRTALKRDNYCCQRCGKTKGEIGRKPDVHHIIPFKKFNDYLEANKLENLISLCHSCHLFVEWNGMDFEINKNTN